MIVQLSKNKHMNDEAIGSLNRNKWKSNLVSQE